MINFFGPAVFALVIQHLAITLTALSMVRERLSGQMDRFRVAPVTSMELLVGKYVAYAVLSLAVSARRRRAAGRRARRPAAGQLGPFVGIVLLLTFASLGVGLLISLIADSERQAVQLSMLILLASVFFSGFVLPVTDFATWMQYLAYALPVTHGIASLQELMLRGGVRETWMLGALLGIGIVLYVGSLLRLRRVIRTRRLSAQRSESAPPEPQHRQPEQQATGRRHQQPGEQQEHEDPERRRRPGRVRSASRRALQLVAQAAELRADARDIGARIVEGDGHGRASRPARQPARRWSRTRRPVAAAAVRRRPRAPSRGRARPRVPVASRASSAAASADACDSERLPSMFVNAARPPRRCCAPRPRACRRPWRSAARCAPSPRARWPRRPAPATRPRTP